MMLSLEFTIFSYTVMYLVPAPPPPFPHPPKMQNISFVLWDCNIQKKSWEQQLCIFGGGGVGGVHYNVLGFHVFRRQI